MITVEIPANALQMAINNKTAYIHLDTTVEKMQKSLKILENDHMAIVQIGKITMKVE